MNDITQLSTLYSNAIARAEKAENENRHLQSLNLGAHDVIARIWAIFGTPLYEDLRGKSIYDLIQDAVDRAEKAEEALRKSEWQPIEMAPKDGSTFIAIMARAYSPRATLCRCESGKYFSPSQGEKFVLPGWNQWWPTHWMPLPSPPPPVRETP